MPGRFALILGNSSYIDSHLSRLQAPDIDIAQFSEVLKDSELGGFSDVKVIENGDYATIRREIARFFSNRERNDLLLVYFSGHGVLDDRGRLYLAVKDTEHDLLSGTSIAASAITDEMDNCRSSRQILMLDCCHSGAFARGAKGAIGAAVGVQSAFMGTGSGRVILTATDSTEYAWEGEKIIGESQNSVFTHYLIEGIKTGEADLNQDGNISIDELYEYVHDKVIESRNKQTPGKWSYKQQGEIIVAKSHVAKTSIAEEKAGDKKGVVVRLSEETAALPLLNRSIEYGLASGFVTALLLSYPMYSYMPSLYLPGWHRSSVAIAVLAVMISLLPNILGGWMIAKPTKSGIEAIFLGSVMGVTSGGVIYAGVIFTAIGVVSAAPFLQLQAGSVPEAEFGRFITPTVISVIENTSLAWMMLVTLSILLTCVGTLLNVPVSKKRSLGGFNLTIDVQWWRTIFYGMISCLFISVFSISVFSVLQDAIISTATKSGVSIGEFEVAVLLFPQVVSVAALVILLILEFILTRGLVPRDPDAQRSIALASVLSIAAAWFVVYRFWRISASNHAATFIVAAIACTVCSEIVVSFAWKLIKSSEGLGRLKGADFRGLLRMSFCDAATFLLIATPSTSLMVFFVVVIVLQIGNLLPSPGFDSVPLSAMISNAYGIQILVHVVLLIAVWFIFYVINLAANASLILWNRTWRDRSSKT